VTVFANLGISCVMRPASVGCTWNTVCLGLIKHYCDVYNKNSYVDYFKRKVPADVVKKVRQKVTRSPEKKICTV
jgi:hypothetical protein